MGNFLAEIKRRHIYRVAAAYAVVAWVLIQLASIVTPMFDLPDWVGRATFWFLIAGLPVALLFAWIHELAPASPSPERNATGKLDLALFAALIAVIGIFAYQQLAPSARTGQAGVDAAREAAASPAGLSLAVLPFTNLSSDPEQEFFSDGMTEEITAALAKVPDLRVVARTSAFEFKGQNRNIQSIGEQLHATHLVEGSVRKAGDRVRITVQLIRADDGTHLWSESYDRQLTDVFAIQEDIARTVTASLNMSLGLNPGENLVNNRNIDPESYEKYLRAKGIFDGRGTLQDREDAESLLNGVVAKSPNYWPAWALLSGVYFVIGNNHAANAAESIAESRARADEFRAKGEAAARRAIQADPNLALAYGELAALTWSRAKPLQAEELFVKALALDPVDATVLDAHAIRLGAAGRLQEALTDVEKARAVEPFAPPLLQRITDYLWLNRQNDAAIALAMTMRPINRAPKLAMIYASMGRYDEAADALMEVASDPNSAAAQAASLLRTAPSTTESSDTLPRLPNALEFVYLYVGAPERALATYERRVEVGFLGANSPAYVWHPSYAPVRKTERFKTLMRKVGLVDYWRAKGWPPQCHPTTADDFVCE